MSALMKSNSFRGRSKNSKEEVKNKGKESSEGSRLGYRISIQGVVGFHTFGKHLNDPKHRRCIEKEFISEKVPELLE